MSESAVLHISYCWAPYCNTFTRRSVICSGFLYAISVIRRHTEFEASQSQSSSHGQLSRDVLIIMQTCLRSRIVIHNGYTVFDKNCGRTSTTKKCGQGDFLRNRGALLLLFCAQRVYSTLKTQGHSLERTLHPGTASVLLTKYANEQVT